jgi:glycosyltransferase involved in cell wall biosynthesis
MTPLNDGNSLRGPAVPVLPEVGILALVPDDWSSRWMIRHQIMARLGAYFRVLWVNPGRHWRSSLSGAPTAAEKLGTGEFPGFSVFQPSRWLPHFYRPGWLGLWTLSQRILSARRTLIASGCKKIVLYLWRPEFESVLTAIPSDLTCYHLEDEYSFSRIELPIDATEARLLESVDEVFILSPALFAKKGNLNSRSTYLPGAVDFKSYSRPLPQPPDLAAIPYPRIGYVGSLKWQIDWPLILELTAKHPNWSFVFVGPMSPHPEIDAAITELKSRENVYFLGGKPSVEMMAYPQHFDVCIMPYGDNPYTKYIYPLKLHEYLAGGKPLVGTPIDSLVSLGDVVLLPKSAEEWSSAIELALGEQHNSEEQRLHRQKFAMQHDWSVLVQQISETISKRLGPAFAYKLLRHFQEQESEATSKEI